MASVLEFIPFTCVLESEDAFHIYFFAAISLTFPFLVLAALSYALFWKDRHTLYVVGALMATVVWTYTIKELTRIDRPRPLCNAAQYMGHSMPSVYASAIAFLVCYYLYNFWRHAYGIWTLETLLTRTAVPLLYLVLVCVSRVVLEFARLEDVLLGAALGFWCAIAFIFVLGRQKYTQYKSTLKED